MSKMVKCKTCGEEIAKSAKVCPKCGAKNKKPNILLGVLAVVLVIGVIGALGGEDDEPKKVGDVSTAGQSSVASTPKTFKVGEKVELNDVVVTLMSVKESTGSQFLSPSNGNTFVVCEFEIENNSKNELNISSLLCFKSYFDSYSTSMSLSATASVQNKSQLDGTVAPGKKMNGVIGYEVASDWKECEIHFTPDFWNGKQFVFTYTK